MRIKSLITMFLIGIIAGLALSPFTNEKPEQAVISPVYPSLAQTKGNFNLNNKKVKKPKSQFGFLLKVKKMKKEKVLAAKTKSKAIKKPSQKVSYSGKAIIAVVGDSIVDVMGRDLLDLKAVLKSYFPQTQFNLLNYGMGSQNIEAVKKRIKKSYNYKDRHYLSLAALNPDIVVIESCAYNPFASQENQTDKHWLALSQLVDFIKKNTKAKIIIMAAIAPAKAKFGQGPNGVNWPADLAWQQAEKINSLLDNAVKFSYSAGLPLVDAYHPSLLKNGEGNPAYINANDHIHQSKTGNKFMARLIGQKIFQILTN